MTAVIDSAITDDYALYQGDCVPVIRGLPDASVHFSIFSPPFSGLYIYSDSEADMGNSADDREFFEHFGYLVPELFRVTIPGRLCAVHCKQLVDYIGRDGASGLRDFRGNIIRAMESGGWKLHSEITIWIDPVQEMQRTKSHGLLHKQLCADSTFSRQGLAEYLLLFRRWPQSEREALTVQPVHGISDRVRFSDYHGTMPPRPDEYERSAEPDRQYSISVWQRYASPVWFDINRMDVLNTAIARDDQDEKHICPLQLTVIRRAIELWTNPGDVVLDPFAGIGSTGHEALTINRRHVGIELKAAYYRQALATCERVISARRQLDLFALAGISVGGA